MLRWALSILMVFSLNLALAGRVQAAPQFSPPQPVQVEGAKTYDFRSAVTGRDYRLFVYIPDGPPPPDGFPVVYVLDGNSSFYSALTSARSQAMFGEIRSAIVVGIGYPMSDPMEILKTRNKDLTTPITADVLGRMPPNPGLTPENTGGLDAFLQMIDIEVKPFVASLQTINRADQTLIGHSLGGLAVVRALMTQPTAYRTFVSASPSLFWNERAVLSGLPELVKQIRSGAAQPRVLLMVGALEGSPSGYRTGPVRMTQRQVDDLIQTTRMVDNLVQLDTELEAVRGQGQYRAKAVIFSDESHLSVIPAALSRGLNFALSVYGDGLPPRATVP